MYLFVRNLSRSEDNTILSYRLAMKWTSFCVKVDFQAIRSPFEDRHKKLVKFTTFCYFMTKAKK